MIRRLRNTTSHATEQLVQAAEQFFRAPLTVERMLAVIRGANTVSKTCRTATIVSLGLVCFWLLARSWQHVEFETLQWWQSPWWGLGVALLLELVAASGLGLGLLRQGKTRDTSRQADLETCLAEFRNAQSNATLQRRAVAKPITEIKVGNELYRLRQTSLLRLVPEGGTWRATLTGLDPKVFQGDGATGQLAEEQLWRLVHRDFQRLYKRRPFQHNDQTWTLWSELNQLIDVEHYQRNQSEAIFLEGQVLSIDDRHLTFQWLGGGIVALDISLLGSAWFELHVGDSFEAVLWRSPSQAGEFQRAEFVRHVAPSPAMTAQELDSWINEIPAAQLPPRHGSRGQ